MRTYPTLFTSGLVVLALLSPGFGQNQSGFSGNSAASTTPANAPNSAAQRENYDPLLDLPPLQHHPVTLMGGTVLTNDEVMNRMTFRPFGTKDKLQVRFDTRTHFYLDGKPITEREIKQGQRIYLDTMLDHERVFAKTIWIRSTADSGVGRGQIIGFDPGRKILTVRDELSNQPVKLQLTATTVVRRGNQTASLSDLTQGTLVDLDFGAQRELRRVTLLATPGSTFTFSGRVTYVDVSQKLIAIDNQSDGKKYDINMEAIAASLLHQIHEGQDVSVSAVFNGSGYSARRIDFAAANSRTP
ncbi:MAG TPA: hypothetical protein VJO35_16505 [Terriglobales bacterium]|nr:hypothetical protein [Terriglobales bacterium]